jgi:hypothetical protein
MKHSIFTLGGLALAVCLTSCDKAGKPAASSAPAASAPASSAPASAFRPIFNGKDLTGWHGLNPHSVDARLEGEKKEAIAEKDARRVRTALEASKTANSSTIGTGPYATTDAELGDIELLIEYKTVAEVPIAASTCAARRRCRSGTRTKSSTRSQPDA